MLFHYIPLLYVYEIFILIYIFIKVKFVTVIVTIVCKLYDINQITKSYAAGPCHC